MPLKTIELLKKGLEANNCDPCRKDNIICLPQKGKLIIAGDIHGHLRNFERIVNFADLDKNPDSHVILQEIIHGGIEDQFGGCVSYKLLFKAIEYKLKFPKQVHFILANHDTAFINNSEVMKDGKEMNRSMREALDREFQTHKEDVKLAIRQFLFSQPLAVKTKNRIWVSHSLPADRYADKFDPDIFNRELRVNDVVRPGSAYLLTWGRRQSQILLDKMAELLDVDFFILGHQAQKKGWTKAGENLIIIASDHNHGCIICIDLEKHYTIDQLEKEVLTLASLQ